MGYKTFALLVGLALCVAGKEGEGQQNVVNEGDCKEGSSFWFWNKKNCKNVAGQPAAAAQWDDLKSKFFSF